jgi:hypothetical protein
MGLTVTEVARIGLTQVEPEPAQQSWRDMPIYGSTVGRVADIAAAASRTAYESHVKAGRLETVP